MRQRRKIQLEHAAAAAQSEEALPAPPPESTGAEQPQSQRNEPSVQARCSRSAAVGKYSKTATPNVFQ
jgi:hypothetical protein